MKKKNSEWGIGKLNFQFKVYPKSFLLSLAYKILGDSIWERVGVEPSGNPFNSLVQLEADNGIPRNPFINAGAIVVCDMLISHTANATADFLQFVREICSNNQINYSSSIAKSEKSVGYRNRALCNFIKSFGNIKNDPEEVLDFYFHMCSIEMTCQELTKTFMFLADDNFRTLENDRVLNRSQAKRVNAIMQTCGFYDESGEFSFKVGLPGKSGVGGGNISATSEQILYSSMESQIKQKRKFKQRNEIFRILYD